MTTSNNNLEEAPKSRSLRLWQRYVPIVLLVLMGVASSFSALYLTHQWEHERKHSAFNWASHDHIHLINREFKLHLEILRDISRFFQSSGVINRQRFHEIASPAIERYNSIRALQWVPHILHSEREAYTEKFRHDVAKFRISEKQAQSIFASVAGELEYFPVYHVEPYEGNEERLGRNLASDPVKLKALQQARDSGQTQLVSSPTPSSTGRNAVIEIYQPIYVQSKPPLTVESRRKFLRGIFVGVFSVRDLINAALTGLRPSGINMHLFDISNSDDETYIYTHLSRLERNRSSKSFENRDSATDWTFIRILNVADSRWKVVCETIPGKFQPDLLYGWMVLVAGIAFTTLLSIYLLTLAGRDIKVRLMVEERTAQLVEMNDALNIEITERERADRKLHALNATLELRVARRSAESERRARELEQFAYVTSHDLKAPLRAVSNLTSWLEEDLKSKLTHETREQMELLRDRVRRMNDLIEGLLEYSRVGYMESSIEEVDIGELLAETVDSLSIPASFKIEIGENMPTLNTERMRLGQVFANLISNAIKHHGRAVGQVKVTVARKNGSYRFSVSDDGKGIPAQFHHKVFKMFQTLEARDHSANTGVGLALVSKIVEEHGGKVSLKSAEGKGATFSFTWEESRRKSNQGSNS